MYSHFFKRFFDIILSLFGLIALSPILFIMMILIKIDSRGPVFFRQERIAKYKTKFFIYKFRSMQVNTPHDIPTHLLDNTDVYITKIGFFLRKTSIDELPQLLNVVKGDMSLVGPRPCLPNQFDLIYERDKFGSNNIRPGLTGLAQISGRDELSIKQKAYYDGVYTSKISFINDAVILFHTVVSVFKHSGVREGIADGELIKNPNPSKKI